MPLFAKLLGRSSGAADETAARLRRFMRAPWILLARCFAHARRVAAGRSIAIAERCAVIAGWSVIPERGAVIAGWSVIAAAVWMADDAAASPFATLDSSARGTALSGVMAALAEDADANLWNPAGLLELEGREITAAHADLFGLDLVDVTTVQFGWPIAEKEIEVHDGQIVESRLPPPAVRAFGAYFSSLGAESLTSTYRESFLGFSYAWRAPWQTRAGASIRVLRASSDLDGVGASGYSADLGIQRWIGPFKLGIVAHDLVSSVDWDEGTDDSLPQRWQLGLAWMPSSRWRTAVEGSWKSGATAGSFLGGAAEWDVVSLLTLRGALRSRTDSQDQEMEYSAGAGLRWSGLRFDYAFVENGYELGTTHRWSASLGL